LTVCHVTETIWCSSDCVTCYYWMWKFFNL